MRPLQGMKNVQPQYQVMNSIAPDFNDQKITNVKNGSVLKEHVGVHSDRTTDMHLITKRNDELFYSTWAVAGLTVFLLYVKMT